MNALYIIGGLSFWFWLTWNFSPFRYITFTLCLLGLAVWLTGG